MNLHLKKQLNLAESKLAVSDAGVMEFTGYGAAFNNVDSYGDVIQPGAFDGFLQDVQAQKQNWPAMLMQHGGWGVTSTDMTPIGAWTSITEDTSGLKVTGTLADTPRGNEAYALLKMQPRPAISGLSIGFYTRKSSFGGKDDVFDRKLEQIDLLEISLVTFPANDKARISGVKSSNDFTEREFEQILRDSGFTKKEAMIIISQGFKALNIQRDADDKGIKQIIAEVQRNSQVLKNYGV
jgi:HK97 family phage prohead protease